MSHPHVDLVVRYYEALNARNFSAYDALFVPDVELESVGGVRGKGIEAVKGFDRVWTEGSSNFTVKGIFHVADGDRVVCHNHAEGVHDGVLHLPSGDVPPTGAVIGGPYFASFQIRAGRIATELVYFDRLVIAEQVGLLPKAPR